MNKLLTTLLAIGSLCLGNSAVAESQKSVDVGQANVLRAALQTGRPGLKVGEIRHSPIAGLYEVQIGGGDLVYMPTDGSYLISGTAYRIEPGKFVNVADERMKPERAAKLAAVKRNDMVIFSPKEEPKSHIFVFTDIDCGFCRKLHREVPELNALGIEVRYLAFPRAGAPSPSADKLATVWCAADKSEAMTQMKTGGGMAVKTCANNPIAAQFKLGESLGVNGTPAIFTPDGTLLPGFMPAAELAATLGITAPAAAAPNGN
jgi:thiol:disulfide interchange protein DsbC